MPKVARCVVRKEPIFINLLLGLLHSGDLPDGNIVDAGAHIGQETCLFAQSAPQRTVLAVEPLANNVDVIKRRALPNVRTVQGSLGNTSCYVVPRRGPKAAGQMFSPDRIHHTVTNTSGAVRGGFRQYTLDELLPSGRTALIHLDVEGTELDALWGSQAILARDQPVVTTEVFVHQRPELSRALVSHMATRGYESYLVEEVCGTRMDCRNLIHLPKSRAKSLMRTPAAGVAWATYRLLAVDATNITDYAFPCCVVGGECCPKGARANAQRTCCTHEIVSGWLRLHGRSYLSGSRAEAINPPVYERISGGVQRVRRASRGSIQDRAAKSLTLA